MLPRRHFHRTEHDVGSFDLSRLTIDGSRPTGIVGIGEDEVAITRRFNINHDLLWRVGNDGRLERWRNRGRSPSVSRSFISFSLDDHRFLRIECGRLHQLHRLGIIRCELDIIRDEGTRQYSVILVDFHITGIR